MYWLLTILKQETTVISALQAVCYNVPGLHIVYTGFSPTDNFNFTLVFNHASLEKRWFIWQQCTQQWLQEPLASHLMEQDTDKHHKDTEVKLVILVFFWCDFTEGNRITAEFYPSLWESCVSWHIKLSFLNYSGFVVVCYHYKKPYLGHWGLEQTSLVMRCSWGAWSRWSLRSFPTWAVLWSVLWHSCCWELLMLSSSHPRREHKQTTVLHCTHSHILCSCHQLKTIHVT